MQAAAVVERSVLEDQPTKVTVSGNDVVCLFFLTTNGLFENESGSSNFAFKLTLHYLDAITTLFILILVYNEYLFLL